MELSCARCNCASVSPRWVSASRNHVPPRTSRRARSRIRATGEDDAPELTGDWRAFRAGLMKQDERGGWTGGEVSSPNMELLKQQDPVLGEEAVWAHPVERIERGGVLLASPKAPELLSDPRMWQLVVLVLEHSATVSRGVILNRPAFPNISDLLGFRSVTDEVKRLSHAFADNAIYLGGMYQPSQMSAQKLTMLHPHKQLLDEDAGALSPCKEIAPGIYVHGEVPASQAVLDGKLEASSFRFFLGMLEWGPGQLQMETNSGIWHTAACSRNLVTKQCLKLPVPLWREIVELMGGEYAAAATQESSS